MEPSSIRIVPSLAAAFLIILYVVLPSSEAAISCSDVIMDMQPCINYLISGIGLPPAPCCAGVSNLASTATTTPDKQTACTCLKNASRNINLKPELAKSLPENCGISLPFAVSPDVDCSE
ncbi:non-specific lipid-transfer protein 8-like [Primulina tabacum]|uniref:non-specific lipid-transfer protein 8-like n=1 Tax=Primulina tabacum TaxID=48773 RepID=UPI003F59E0FD